MWPFGPFASAFTRLAESRPEQVTLTEADASGDFALECQRRTNTPLLAVSLLTVVASTALAVLTGFTSFFVFGVVALVLPVKLELLPPRHLRVTFSRRDGRVRWEGAGWWFRRSGSASLGDFAGLEIEYPADWFGRPAEGFRLVLTSPRRRLPVTTSLFREKAEMLGLARELKARLGLED